MSPKLEVIRQPSILLTIDNEILEGLDAACCWMASHKSALESRPSETCPISVALVHAQAD